MEQTGKEPIQAQSQSTRRLKRNRASAYATPSVDEKGREMLVCNFCHSVIRVGGEIASSEKETSEVHLTVLGEGKEEIPSRIVKRRTLSGINDPSQLTIKFAMQMVILTNEKELSWIISM